MRIYARSPDFLAFRIAASAVFFVPLYPLGRIVGAMTPPDAEAEQHATTRLAAYEAPLAVMRRCSASMSAKVTAATLRRPSAGAIYRSISGSQVRALVRPPTKQAIS